MGAVFLRVLHTMPDIDKEASGPSYSVIRLSESLTQASVQSQVALLGDREFEPYIRAFPRGLGPSRLGRSPQMERWLYEVVKAGAVDIMHNHSLWMMPNVYPGWATKDSAIPYVVSPRGTLSKWAMQSGSKIKQLFWPLIQRPSISHAACFHATAEAEYEDIRRMGYKQPVALIPNGIDLPEFSEAKVARKVRTLLFLGRLHPVKGVDFLLNAWRTLEHEFPDWNLRIVGPDNNHTAKELINLARDLALQRVEFSGAVYGSEKFNAYRDADLYVLPTHSENFAMTVAEALACATPVVVSQGAPWSGVAAHGAGWWPEIGEVPLLSSLRVAMSLTREDLMEMGENGRRWMQDEFAWNGIAYKMRDMYLWLLGRGDRPSCVELA